MKILSLFQRLLYFVQCSDSFFLIFQTLIGDILIAVNPFTEMYIYSKEVRHEYEEDEGHVNVDMDI